MALIPCEECGRQISDRAVSCPGCGCPVNPEGERCPECGGEVSSDSQACPSCGYPLTDGANEAAATADVERTTVGNPYKGKTNIVYGVLATLTGILCLFIFSSQGQELFGLLGAILVFGGIGLAILGRLQRWWHWT